MEHSSIGRRFYTVATWFRIEYKPRRAKGDDMGAFTDFFHGSEPTRDTYVSRLFGLFSEEVVRAWWTCPEAPSTDLGGPTPCDPGLVRGHTLDFTLRSRDSGKDYAAEPNCELEYDGYRSLVLTHGDRLRRHTSGVYHVSWSRT